MPAARSLPQPTANPLPTQTCHPRTHHPARAHAQLLGPDELAPGINAAEFEARRQALAQLMQPGEIALAPAASQSFVTGVIPYPYRQDADFLYLTGKQLPCSWEQLPCGLGWQG